MKSQKQQILEILLDGKAHRSDEFQKRLFGSMKYGLFRLGARIWEIKKHGYEIRGWHDEKNPALYWYQIVKFPALPIMVSSIMAEGKVEIKEQKQLKFA